jgi:hypothetical protein
MREVAPLMPLVKVLARLRPLTSRSHRLEEPALAQHHMGKGARGRAVVRPARSHAPRPPLMDAPALARPCLGRARRRDLRRRSRSRHAAARRLARRQPPCRCCPARRAPRRAAPARGRVEQRTAPRWRPASTWRHRTRGTATHAHVLGARSRLSFTPVALPPAHDAAAPRPAAPAYDTSHLTCEALVRAGMEPNPGPGGTPASDAVLAQMAPPSSAPPRRPPPPPRPRRRRRSCRPRSGQSLAPRWAAWTRHEARARSHATTAQAAMVRARLACRRRRNTRPPRRLRCVHRSRSSRRRNSSRRNSSCSTCTSAWSCVTASSPLAAVAAQPPPKKPKALPDTTCPTCGHLCRGQKGVAAHTRIVHNANAAGAAGATSAAGATGAPRQPRASGRTARNTGAIDGCAPPPASSWAWANAQMVDPDAS